MLIAATALFTDFGGPKTVNTSQAIAAIQDDQVKQATLVDREQRLTLLLTDGSEITSKYIEGQGVQLQEQLQAKVDEGGIPEGYNVEVPEDSLLVTLIVSILPILLIMGLLFFFMSQMQGGKGLMSFGKSKAKVFNKDMPQTTFADVAGADEAVAELQEIKDFLAEPVKFQRVGAKIPKGVLLYGPPGTGKTLLARAVAGEAGVPFFSISGSDFVEMFVGVGASRVRDLFEQAKNNAPAIVFVDEIDAVGRHRGAGLGGGHDEREQTLNQLLVEMDGFDVNTSVILIAATNRPDILDPALLRPGRFDRQIGVDRPDMQGRLQILKVHAKGKPVGTDVDLSAVAKRTPGFTGADLANVLNEAALLTARQNQNLIDNKTMDEAIDRVIAGPQRSSRVMDDRGEAHHGLPRGRPRPSRGRPSGQRPSAQDHDPAARPGVGLHDGAARVGQALGHPIGHAEPVGVHARRPGRGGVDLPRPHHGRLERHREGHQRRARDGHPVRHDGAAGRHQVRQGQRRGVPRDGHGPRP